MKKEYDFKNGIRGRFYKNKKIQKTLRIDEDILDFFTRFAKAEGIPYQTLINLALRKFTVGESQIVLSLKK